MKEERKSVEAEKSEVQAPLRKNRASKSSFRENISGGR